MKNTLLFACVALVAAPVFALQQFSGAGAAGQRSSLPPTHLPPCAPQALTTPVWQAAIPFATPPTCGGSAWPFCARYTPRGDRLYVSLFGGLIGNGGCRVLRLNPVTFNVVGQIATGESPQEIAFVTFANGSLKLGFVSNGSGSTVTVFAPNDSVVATIPIPYASGGAWPTAFPFGLVVSPDQATVYVGTQDGGGTIHAIDTTTLMLDPARAIQLGIDHSAGRMAFAGSKLVIPTTQYLAAFSGATAKLVTVDPAQPQVLSEVVLASSSTGFLFPSPQDCAVDCDGMAWVAGFDMGPSVFGVDAATTTLVHVLPTHTSQPDGKFQGLGLSADGLLVVGDYWTSEIAVLDARLHVWREVLDTSSLPQFQNAPQELEFAPVRNTLVVPWAASDNLGVYDL